MSDTTKTPAAAPGSPTDDAPSKGYRTAVLLVLTLVYTFNFIDRQIVGSLSPFIQADLGLSDRQMGWLKGLAFAILYTSVGIPVAWLADRFNRKRIVAVSLALWSGFTVLTGLAQSWTSILLARIGVGIGEAGGSPPSHSIISDYYPKEARASALGIYSLGIPFGIMFGYFAAGQLVAAFGWRGTLIAVGVPGILLALVVLFFIKEPKRGATEEIKQDVEAAGLIESITYLFRIPSWLFMCLGIAFASFGGYAVLFWGVDYLGRWDPTLLEPERYKWLTVWLGILNGVVYGLGTFGGGVIADKLGKKNVRAYGWLPAVTLAIGAPALLYAFWVDDINTHLMLLAVYLIMAGFYLGPSFAIAQTLAPVNMRAMSTALFFFVLNLIALGGGPTYIGEVSQRLTESHGEISALRLALTSLAIPYALCVISFLLAAVFLPKDWARAEARNAGVTPDA